MWTATSRPATSSSWSSLAGEVVARGVVGYDAAELPSLIGRKTHDLPEEQRREVVHADDLVPLHR